MHGVPPNLPLDTYVGKACIQIALGRFQIQFHFDGAGSIDVEGRWELRELSGKIVDCTCDHDGRDCYRIHRILHVPVTRFQIDPPRSFTLFFESGDSLTVFDESDRYESFSLSGFYI